MKKILKNVVEAENEKDLDSALDVLQEIVTNVQFANDEGDPGRVGYWIFLKGSYLFIHIRMGTSLHHYQVEEPV